MRVHILFEHGQDLRPHGCSYIRLLRPLSHPSISGKLTITSGTAYASADVVIVERLWKPGISLCSAEKLIDQVRRDRAYLVYSVDDNLLELPDEIATNIGLSIEHLMVFRLFCREANGVIVATKNLRDRLRHLNKTVVVVPNALDERLLPNFDSHRTDLEVRLDRRKVIGYMGTYTHDADLMMILQALRQILRQYSHVVELQIIGVTSIGAVKKAFDGLPVRVLDIGTNYEYPDFMQWLTCNTQWDIGIAPLEDNAFNRSKSDIKFLDYSAMGAAGIYSQVPAYEETVRHLDTGYLSDRSVNSWIGAFEHLLNDDELRLGVATRARQHLITYRTLQQCAVEWYKALFSIAD